MKSVAVSIVILGLLVADAIVTTKYGYNHDSSSFYGAPFLILCVVFIFTLILEVTK